MHNELSTYTHSMLSGAQRVLSAINFLTGEGVSHYPDSCDGSTIEALISEYLNKVQSDDENSHRNEGKAITIKINTRNHSINYSR